MMSEMHAIYSSMAMPDILTYTPSYGPYTNSADLYGLGLSCRLGSCSNQ